MSKKYFIGLDIGTESVGWAVTDENYNLLKVRGRDYWGSYLFDPAQTAEKRRLYRASRRRQARIRHRIELLQQLFAEEIAKVDPTFFIRLNNSSLILSDKDGRVRTKNVLFNDNGYGDKDYFKQFPTIFHLRSSLISDEIKDIRLLYLAVHHIIKNRGHFLYEGRDFKSGDARLLNNCLSDISVSYEGVCGETLEGLNADVFSLLCNRNVPRAVKKKEIETCINAGKDKRRQAVAKALCGYKFAIKDVADENDDCGEVGSLCFEDAAYEDNFDKLQATLSDDVSALIRSMKALYDLSVLDHVLHGERYISVAKKKLYDIHETDLKALKGYVKANCPDMYREVFRHVKGKNNYAAYIGMDKNKSYGHCSKQDFYDFLTGQVKVTDPDILKRIEDKEFMPKQISGENCVIPYQVNLDELKGILENAEKYFPFLRKEQDGMTVSDKIISLMTFRIPYYVGPFTTSGSKFSWIVKKEGEESTKITPWNFDGIVDKDKSESRFIERMTNKCTYLNGVDVLPDSSFLYSEFKFLNELNNLKINGVKNEQAKKLIYAYAKENKKVKLKNCLAMLKREGLIESSADISVFSGIDDDFKNSLGSYCDFKKIIGDLADTDTEMCERIILWITVISDKNRLEELIKRSYGKVLDEKQIKSIKGLNYTKWGRLSATLLTDIKSGMDCDEYGECLSIIDSLRRGNENFMELLSSSHGYAKAIEEFNGIGVDDGKVTYKTVENLYCSPAVKRSIWRAVCIVKEVVKSQGGTPPSKIFIEMAREKNDKSRKGQRTVSRKQKLIDLYRSIGSEGKKWEKEIAGNNDDRIFNKDAVYFYYIQKGMDLYTGKQIALEDVFNTNLYDIDHIYPRSKIKDDSLDNRVLVSKSFNEHEKQDSYPLSDEVRKKMLPVWNELRKKGFISEEKYARLTRCTPLTVDECADFINRQLVETRQSTKAVARILKNLLPETDIVYTKAGNANEFKDWLRLKKVRELNNLHHAKDAYVNIVVGNIYNVKFGRNASVYFSEHNIESYNLTKMFVRDVEGAWKVSDKQRIYNTASKNTCRVVRFTGEGSGKMFDANPETAEVGKSNGSLVPIKEKGPLSDVSRYGGYNKEKGAYFMLVRSKNKKGEPMLTLETVTILASKRIATVQDKQRYCREKHGLTEPEILIGKIKLNTLLNINGSYAYLSGRTGNRIELCNANELLLDVPYVEYLKKISKHCKDVVRYRNPNLEVDEDITADKNLWLYDALTEKLGSKVYAGLNVSGQTKNLIAGRDMFIALSLPEQCKVLMEVLKFMQCNSETSDITLIGGTSNAGKVRMGKDVTGKDIKMINESPTGLYRKVINFADLL